MHIKSSPVLIYFLDQIRLVFQKVLGRVYSHSLNVVEENMVFNEEKKHGYKELVEITTKTNKKQTKKAKVTTRYFCKKFTFLLYNDTN